MRKFWIIPLTILAMAGTCSSYHYSDSASYKDCSGKNFKENEAKFAGDVDRFKKKYGEDKIAIKTEESKGCKSWSVSYTIESKVEVNDDETVEETTEEEN